MHRLANGRRYAFTAAADGDFVAPEGLPRRRLERLDATRLAIVHLDGRREIYGERGQLVAEEDRNGNRVDYTREGGELVRVADTNGRFLELARDSTGHVTEVRDHVGRSWRYAYNEDGTLASVTDPLGGTRRYAYETVRRAASAQPYPVITRISDETERTVVAVTYAEDGRVESYTRGENVFTYGTRRGYIEKSDARGSRWSYLLDERGNKTEIWPPINGGEPERRLYTDDGELARLTDVAGTEYAIERDARDRVTALISPDGTIAVRYEGGERLARRGDLDERPRDPFRLRRVGQPAAAYRPERRGHAPRVERGGETSSRRSMPRATCSPVVTTRPDGFSSGATRRGR